MVVAEDEETGGDGKLLARYTSVMTTSDKNKCSYTATTTATYASTSTTAATLGITQPYFGVFQYIFRILCVSLMFVCESRLIDPVLDVCVR
jgi:hypothetical protein